MLTLVQTAGFMPIEFAIRGCSQDSSFLLDSTNIIAEGVRVRHRFWARRKGDAALPPPYVEDNLNYPLPGMKWELSLHSSTNLRPLQ